MRRQAAEARRRQEFEALTAPHLDALYRFAVQKLKDSHQAEDLVQEVCLKAYRGFDRFVRGTDYKAWLFRTLINAFVDLQRKAPREPRGGGRDPEQHLLDRNVEAERSRRLDPEQQLMAASLAQAVQAAVDELPQEWQAVVLLSFVEEFSYREIADMLGCPIGTFMSRLYRARQFLRQRLERSLRGEGDTDPEQPPGQGASVTPIELIRARGQARFKKQEG
jgi:RNA polymerase sigma-70 factor (ECF subfamily)